MGEPESENHLAAILYVEDNPDHAELVRRCFADLGQLERLVHLEDGEQALAYLHRCQEAPRRFPVIVLLDLRLPKVDGFEVLRTIKASDALRSIPVVVLTTSATKGDIERAYESHANSYLVKPNGFSELNRLLRDLSSYWLGWNARATHHHALPA